MVRRLFLTTSLVSVLVAAPSEVRGLLESRCAACHSGKFAKGGLDVTSREGLLKGGARGPAVAPGDPDASLLLRLISHRGEPAMPMGAAKLDAALIASVEHWIREGARWEGPSTGKAASHWAFEKPVRAPLPRIADPRWNRNPVDRFVAARHQQQGLRPAPEADRRTLLRRLFLDLTGVPPTAADVASFVADRSADAYEKRVDNLLASPRYGERWARHWMDVWRYSDWYGYRRANELRYSQKHIWRWRDWIVEAVNGDKPYDRMIAEMLAGDELAPGDPGTLRATGFLARNYNRYDRHGWMQDAVDHTSMAFLGVTVKCARCHDHKYDPISQADYYRMRAIFEPYGIRTDRVAGQPDRDRDGLPRVYDAELSPDTFFFPGGDVQNPDKSRKMAPGVPEALGGAPLRIEPVKLALEARYPDAREFVRGDLIADARHALEAAGEAKEQTWRLAALHALEARVAAERARYADPPDARATELAASARKAERRAALAEAEFHLDRAQLELSAALAAPEPDEKKITEARKKAEAAQAKLSAKPESYTPLGDAYPETSTGRRLALAQWIGSRENPLTARVAINHIWLRHFGKAIVPSVFDFGRNGKPRSHPEILDWLAVEFVENGWRMKPIHRLIVTSAAYRMATTGGNGEKDPDNQYLWRMNSRRMEAEAVRDSILEAAGTLDGQIGGPEISEELALTNRRRSLYFRHAPDLKPEFLRLFDSPNPHEAYERNESIVPQQALAIANSELTQAESRLLAARLWRDLGAAPTDAAFVARAFETILARPASAAEAGASTAFLNEQSALVADPEKLTLITNGAAVGVKPAAEPRARARESLVRALFNSSEFVTIP